MFGVGGGGGNAVNNMITAGLRGVEFVVANTDAQALTMSKSERLIQLGAHVTEGLGAGSQPEVGRAAAEECIDEIIDHLSNTHMCFVTAGMGGGTGTGAAPVVARAAREKGILTVGVVTKPFHFEGQRRMKTADLGIEELQKCVDTLIVIPNQNLFRLANDKTTFADAFAMADQVLYSGVACITDLMVKEGLINLDFADVRSVMREMGKAMMGTGEASGEGRAMAAAEAAIANPLLDETSMQRRQGPADLDHRRPRPDAVRSRRSGDPHPRGSRPGRQHHPRRDLRRGTRRRHPRLGGRDRHRQDGGRNRRRADRDPPGAAEAGRASRRPAEARPAAAPQPRRRSEARAADPVAEAIRQAELNAAALAARPAQPRGDEFRPQSKLFQAPPAAAAGPAAGRSRAAVAAAARDAQPAAAQPRMPRVEDFPPVVKAEVEAKSRPADHESSGPMGLLKRLTNGLTRREEEPAQLQPAQPREPKLRQPAPEARRIASQDPQLYAPRRGQLDEHGRLAPQARPAQEDDQLEIPAFLAPASELSVPDTR